MGLLPSFVWVLLLASPFMGALGNLEYHICTNVSYWKPVVYKPVNVTCCTSKVKTECVETIVPECEDVEETKCDVVGCPDCKMKDCPVNVTDPEPVYTEFTPWNCTFVDVEYKYNKTIHECKNVTREICTTLWERDANGERIWNGKNDCKNATWLECHPKEKPHNITTYESNCWQIEPVKYKTCKNSTSPETHMCTECEAKAASHCHIVVTNKCVNVTVKKCKPVATDICKPCEFLVPSQEFVHQERCLLKPLGETRRAGDHDLDHHHEHEHHHHHVHEQHHHEEDPSGRTRHAADHDLDHHHEHEHHHHHEEEEIDIVVEEETRLKHGIDLPEQSPEIIEEAVKVVVNESPVEAEATPSFNSQHFPRETADGVWTVDDEALARTRNLRKSEHETASSPKFSANPPVFSSSSEKEPAVGRVLRASESGCKSCRLAGYEAAGSTEV